MFYVSDSSMPIPEPSIEESDQHAREANIAESNDAAPGAGESVDAGNREARTPEGDPDDDVNEEHSTSDEKQNPEPSETAGVQSPKTPLDSPDNSEPEMDDTAGITEGAEPVMVSQHADTQDEGEVEDDHPAAGGIDGGQEEHEVRFQNSDICDRVYQIS